MELLFDDRRIGNPLKSLALPEVLLSPGCKPTLVRRGDAVYLENTPFPFSTTNKSGELALAAGARVDRPFFRPQTDPEIEWQRVYFAFRPGGRVTDV